MEIKIKTNKWDLIKQRFWAANKTIKNEKITQRMVENICKKWWTGVNFQNIQTAHTAQYQKNK